MRARATMQECVCANAWCVCDTHHVEWPRRVRVYHVRVCHNWVQSSVCWSNALRMHERACRRVVRHRQRCLSSPHQLFCRSHTQAQHMKDTPWSPEVQACRQGALAPADTTAVSPLLTPQQRRCCAAHTRIIATITKLLMPVRRR